MIFNELFGNAIFLCNKDFDSQVWKNNPKKRRCYIKNILSNPLFIGKDKTEVKEIFGISESYSAYPNRWSYHVYTGRKKRYYLAFYFSEERLADIRYESKIN